MFIVGPNISKAIDLAIGKTILMREKIIVDFPGLSL